MGDLNKKMIWIKEMMTKFYGIEKKVAVIRHAERPDFKSLKNESELGITNEGCAAAIQLGEEIGFSQNTSNFQVFSWGSRRVTETAKAVAIGLAKTKRNVVGPSPIVFPSPIRNCKEYEKAFASGRWNEYVENWLSGQNPQAAFLPVETYAKATYQSLLDEKYCASGKVSIIITHDLHIMPLIKYAFPSFRSWIKYLDGIVLKDDGDKILIGFDGESTSIKRNALKL